MEARHIFFQRMVQEMVKQLLKLGGDKNEKKNFDYHKNSIDIDNADINNLIVSEAFVYGKNKKI